MRLLLPFLAAAALGGCATTNSATTDPRDPYERFNRGVFAFNQAADRAVVKPVATAYRTVTPVPARRGLTRVIANLFEPVNFLNNLLQGKPKRAFNSLGRFLVNTTIGVGGLADHATGLGLPATNEDYGQTFAKYGARNSPYVVLPLLGPSTVRDAVGTAINLAASPVGIALNEVGASTAEQAGATALQVINSRSNVIDGGADTLIETSADPYAAARSAYLQLRDAQIEDREGTGQNLNPEQEQDLLDEALEDGAAAGAPVPGTAAPPAASPPRTVDPAAPPADPNPPTDSTAAADPPRLIAQPTALNAMN